MHRSLVKAPRKRCTEMERKNRQRYRDGGRGESSGGVIRTARDCAMGREMGRKLRKMEKLGTLGEGREQDLSGDTG